MTTGPEFTYVYTITVSTLAGTGAGGYFDGDVTAAKFHNPTGVCCDSQGNIYVADNGNNLIRIITPDGKVSTLAGAGGFGYADGQAPHALFFNPTGVACDGHGNVYVADFSNNRIRKIAGGIVSTLAGTGAVGDVDGDGGIAKFAGPGAVVCDASGIIYVADEVNNSIRSVTPSGAVNTIAGTGFAGYADGDVRTAQFNRPTSLACDSLGNIYVADYNNNRIRKVTPSGVVSTVAGTGYVGSVDGNGATAEFVYPVGIACDHLGSLYVTDVNACRKITPAGIVSTLAGSTVSGFVNGNGTIAQFYYPGGVAVDAQGNIYIADSENNRIRKITVE
jgi:sugar lactone lactonase YvrE